jgi:ABC-type Fe3+/spermidine/putrescine transport system ATPase subunit
MALLHVLSISKSFAGRPALRDVSFQVEAGEIVCLLGPSGCGKTTLLRIIAGLEKADGGRLVFEDRPLDEVPVHRRGFGLMFQEYALFPHKDVADNVTFGLQMQAADADRVQARLAEMLDLVGLRGYERRRVYDLSGGEQQRVALARSLAPGPRLLMLDEPLGSLDRARREELMNELRAILKRVGVTAIYVTHDQEEAFAVADRVIVLDRGRLVQQGAPQAVYRRPASSWVARFLGLTNLLPGRVVALDPPQVDTPLGRVPVPADTNLAAGQAVSLLIRPEAARLAGPEAGPTALTVHGRVRACSFRGGHYRLLLGHESGLDLAFELPSVESDLPEPGQVLTLLLRPEGISLLPEETDGQTATA